MPEPRQQTAPPPHPARAAASAATHLAAPRSDQRCRRSAPVAALVLMLLGAAAPLGAHQLRIFAAPDGAGQIAGRVYFAGGAPATGARIQILDAQGRVLAVLQPDADGRFHYAADQAEALQLLADSGDGHQARWVRRPEPASAISPTSPPPAPDTALLEAQIRQAVRAELLPLREQLATEAERVRLRDVLGGLGYILGLVGLALWWRYRPRRPS